MRKRENRPLLQVGLRLATYSFPPKGLPPVVTKGIFCPQPPQGQARPGPRLLRVIKRACPYPETRSAKINARTERKAASGRSRTWMLCMAALLSCLPTRRLTAANSSRCDLCRRAAERVIARGLNKGGAGWGAERRGASHLRLSADPAKEPSDKRTEYQPGFGRERNVGGHA
jgi:hypothetical protein